MVLGHAENLQMAIFDPPQPVQADIAQYYLQDALTRCGVYGREIERLPCNHDIPSSRTYTDLKEAFQLPFYLLGRTTVPSYFKIHT